MIELENEETIYMMQHERSCPWKIFDDKLFGFSLFCWIEFEIGWPYWWIFKILCCQRKTPVIVSLWSDMISNSYKVRLISFYLNLKILAFSQRKKLSMDDIVFHCSHYCDCAGMPTSLIHPSDYGFTCWMEIAHNLVIQMAWIKLYKTL